MMKKHNYKRETKIGTQRKCCPSYDIHNPVPQCKHSINATKEDMHRVVSLSAVEKLALTSILLDSVHDHKGTLTKDILLTTPFSPSEEVKRDSLQSERKRDQDETDHRHKNSKQFKDIWKAHEIGILPKILRKGSDLFVRAAINRRSTSKKEKSFKNVNLPLFPSTREVISNKDLAPRTLTSDVAVGLGSHNSASHSYEKQDSSNVSMMSSTITPFDERSDVSQYPVYSKHNDEVSSVSTWEYSLEEQFDTWQVLNDEYADDFGYGCHSDLDGKMDDSDRDTFKILGTSADDISAQPHVLSPPLMESLLNFVPEHLSSENLWLKYSLVRDGASLDTFRNYLKAAQYTIIAIQTTSGDVFGSFTSSLWQEHHGYFGSGEAFVWKMKTNRFHPCSSLYEQAHIESEIEVFPFTGLNSCVQLLEHDRIALGGGEIEQNLNNEFTTEVFTEEQRLGLGFAFVLHDDLQRGTSGRSATFCNPVLMERVEDGGVFEVQNIEAWTFTPCLSVESAEELELKKHFRHESVVHEYSKASINSYVSTESPTSPTLSKRNFYRRLGENDEDEFQRDSWVLANMKNDSTFRSMSSATPKFV